MSIVPEIILQRVFVAGLRKIRQDPRMLDVLFKNLGQKQLAEIKEFLTKTPINFSVNYPRTDLKVPALVLLLKNELEAQTFLGDIMGTEPGEDSSFDTLGGGGVSTTSGLPKLWLGNLGVTSATTTRLYFLDADYERINELLDTENLGAANLHVTAGSGAGKVYPITRINTDYLDIEGTFDPQLSTTSIVDIRDDFDPELAMGEPSQVYDASRNDLWRIGSNYDVQYQLEVLAGHQDEVIYLYSILKALLLANRETLEAQGIMALKISGSDFAPRSEYLPSDVFQRTMILQFTYPFSFLKEIDAASSIVLRISPDDPNTGEFGEMIEIEVDVG